MAETFGKLRQPVQPATSTDAAADPALSRLGEYLQAILNAHGQAAFDRLGFPIINGVRTPVVRTIWTHDPTEYVFNTAHLPAMYITRGSGGKPEWHGEDYLAQPDIWTVEWVFPPGQQANQRTRDSFTNAICKLIVMAIERVRDPVWVWGRDPDPKAASLVAVPAVIKTEIASSLSPVTYTGGALDGPFGASLFAPGRHPTITISGTASDIEDGSVVEVVGLGDDGTPRSSLITLSAATGVYIGDWLLTQVDTIYMPAQLGTGAIFTFGLDAFTGRGTSIITSTGLQDIEVTSWSDKMIAIRMAGTGPTRTYDAIELKLATQERWVQDTAHLTSQGLETVITYSDGQGVYERMILP